jgi:hypothetical protein
MALDGIGEPGHVLYDVKLPLLRETKRAAEGLALRHANAGDSGAPRCFQFRIQQILLVAGCEKQKSVEALKIAVDGFIGDNPLDVVDRVRVAFGRHAGAALAVQAFDFEITVVPIGPSSSTITDFPSRARVYAVVSPAIPAPMTQTLTSSSASRDGRGEMSAVAVHNESVLPASLFIVSAPR